MAKKTKLKIITKTDQLSNGEQIALKRRRSKLSQANAAKAFGVSLFSYRQAENDIWLDPPKSWNVRKGKVSPEESCFIERRRSGKTVGEIAAEIGCCVYWFRMMENGIKPSERVVEYWYG